MVLSPLGVPSDVELLAIEIDTLWPKDERGRLLKSQNAQGWTARHLLIGASTDGWTLAFGSEVPQAVATELQAAFDVEPPAADPSKPPRLFERCEQLLAETFGPMRRADGRLSYLVPPTTSFDSDVEIHLSDSEVSDRLHHQDFERINWTAEEWRHLLDGELGPWAFVVTGDRVVSICHSARLTDRGAEAGTWTDPDYRGQGYAATATAAWALLLAPSGRHLFYSTGADNLASQRVAERLGLPLIGWMWSLFEQ